MTYRRKHQGPKKPADQQQAPADRAEHRQRHSQRKRRERNRYEEALLKAEFGHQTKIKF